MTPRAASSLSMRRPAAFLTAAVRLIARPAPWHVVPKVRSMLPGWPTSTQLARPMSPGMITGWPMARYMLGTSGWPGGKAGAAPLAVDPDALLLAGDRVLLELGDVVADVVDEVHLHFLPALAKDISEHLAGLLHEELAVTQIGRAS